MHSFLHTPGALIAQAVSFPTSPAVRIELLPNIPSSFLALGFSGAAISASFTFPSTCLLLVCVYILKTVVRRQSLDAIHERK